MIDNKLVMPGLEVRSADRPGYKDLTADDRALIARGGRVGWRKTATGYEKTIRYPSESDRLRAQHKAITARIAALKIEGRKHGL
jgi:hypothetical protein